MEREQVDRIEVVDTLGLIRQEVVKATCLSWDVNSDYFQPLEYAVDKHNWPMVRMMAECDAYIIGAKAEIVSDILEHIAEMIDEYFKSIGHKRGGNISAARAAGIKGERGESNGYSDMEARG